jgi:hypothetical protein
MQFKVRGALGAAALSIAALAAVPAAQAQPSVCSTRAFRAADAAVNANPRGAAELLSLTYRFAPQATAEGFDTLVQCDATAAQAVFGDFQTLNSAEASSFQAYFAQLYPADAGSVFGVHRGGGGGLA